MALAYYRNDLTDSLGNAVAGASVTVREHGTLNAITETIKTLAGATLTNPLTSASTGTIEFALDEPKRVDLYIVASGLLPKTITVDVLPSGDTLNTGLVVASDYGVKGDGTDESAKLASWLAACAGKVGVLPAGDYKSLATLTVPAGATILAWGARIYDTATHRTLVNLSSNTKVYGLELEGVGNAAYNDAGRGFSVSGTSAAAYSDDILIADCNVHGFGGYGIYGEWCKNVTVKGGRVHNVGYGAVMLLSAVSCKVDSAWIKDVSPGGSGNAYGVSFTRRGATSDTETYPLSVDCSAVNCTVEDIPLWEALDTHGGIRCVFSNNTINNCALGVIVGCATGNAGSEEFPPKGCVVSNNSMNSKKTNGTAAEGIFVGGVIGGAPAEACSVTGNVIIGHGEQSNSQMGAIRARDTRGLTITGNVIHEPSPNGITMTANNYGFAIIGNVVIDAWSNSVSVPRGIYFQSHNQEGVVSGNSDARGAKSATYVLVEGIRITATLTGTRIELGPYSSEATNPIIDASRLGRATMYGGVREYTAGATTIDVSGGVRFVSISNAAATSITNLTGAFVGQEVTLVFEDANTTVTRDNAMLSGGVNFTSTARDTLTLVYTGAYWYEKARGVNA